METKQIEKEASEILGEYFKVLSITDINHRPHQYMIGAGHVRWAVDHHSGMFDADVIRSYEKSGGHCEQRGCRVPYDEHTSGNKVMFLSCKKDVPQTIAQELLNKVVPIMEKNKIEGFVFAQSEEGFRIVKD
jgi:hypothetical protein